MYAIIWLVLYLVHSVLVSMQSAGVIHVMHVMHRARPAIGVASAKALEITGMPRKRSDQIGFMNY